MEFGFLPRTLTDCLGIQCRVSVLRRIGVRTLQWFFTNVLVSCKFRARELIDILQYFESALIKTYAVEEVLHSKYFPFFQRGSGVHLPCLHTVKIQHFCRRISTFGFQCTFFVVFCVCSNVITSCITPLFVWHSQAPGDFQSRCTFCGFFETAEVKHV